MTLSFLETLDEQIAAESERVELLLAECARTKSSPGSKYWEKLFALRQRRRLAAAIVESLKEETDVLV